MIEFPAGWHVGGTAEDPGRSELVCSFFDPEPFNIPPNSDFFGTALEVHVPEVSFEKALAALTDPMFARTLARTRASVAHRRAVRLETEASGQGLLERGTRTYAYLIDRGWLPPFEDVGLPPLLVQTTASPGEDLRWKEVVDRAVRTLRLLPPTVPETPAGLPDAVFRKYFQILAAAEARDYEALRHLVDDREFSYTFGGPAAGGPVAYWRRLERTTDERPIAALAGVLRLPYTLHRGVYVWPFAFDKRPRDVTEYERRLLRGLPGSRIGESGYLGWRAGITPDGRWIFFIAGD